MRQTIGIIERAQRSKMEEIGLKSELLKSIGNMYHFWQTGAEIVENVTFGEHPATTKGRWDPTAPSGGSWNSWAFISIIVATCVIPVEI